MGNKDNAKIHFLIFGSQLFYHLITNSDFLVCYRAFNSLSNGTKNINKWPSLHELFDREWTESDWNEWKNNKPVHEKGPKWQQEKLFWQKPKEYNSKKNFFKLKKNKPAERRVEKHK